MKRHFALLLILPALLAVTAALPACTNQHTTAQPATTQDTYATAEDAAYALITTARKGDLDLLVPIFGPDLAELSAETKERTEGDLQRLAAAYDRKHELILEDDGSVTLLVGEYGWDFPAPIVQQDGRWHFDSVAGAKEIRSRRMDRNETDAVVTCLALVKAQQQFSAMSAARGDTGPSFAPRIRSTLGKRNGLYWDDALGQPASPLGPMVEDALNTGELKRTGGPQPYLGYMFHVLTSQGPGAPGGAKNFIDSSGKMTGGFAFLAWPAEYGETGMMTFQVSSDGTVFQKDLGEATPTAAKSIQAFDPSGWEKVTP